ncbi:MAG: hypothetical protein CO186_12000 [Zetaproteobacteria bacterium CG_4_9_14_3_um_filter_49_83]|nr:MAG: hypothetical protein AUJ56_10405 [Zetaproteobacteria bacterium CG1_02_49_23]PIQ34435.1 MAG: hypothetical protein COW62_01860 [Zetaproteobacteria bacterium CG17_big_fil_post_rev_8_21_14_2_50_50_13]PIV29044.1 MAG: hypothetical protein COS35_14010 [Zetaproteobacteria bacterium CG02_land_8_20_14_3_00_50_9]PIY56418.1 MAG: hypothetical protein COZ00_04360 [Zetaproteobacteria bacterium CG_4_10_14_0_8_um_filter_49_80]PJA34057.1 MAG: hypothetical protein CO186_12000 [Zetaproteobacteria bacterium
MVVDRAGLMVDWTLSSQQDFSNKMRIAAYRPRIDAAYESGSALTFTHLLDQIRDVCGFTYQFDYHVSAKSKRGLFSRIYCLSVIVYLDKYKHLTPVSLFG